MRASPPDEAAPVAPRRRRAAGSYVSLFVHGAHTPLAGRRQIAFDARRRARQRELLDLFQRAAAAPPPKIQSDAPRPAAARRNASTHIEISQAPAQLVPALDASALALAACVGPLSRASAAALARDLRAQEDRAETRLVLCCEMARASGVRAYVDLTAVYAAVP